MYDNWGTDIVHTLSGHEWFLAFAWGGCSKHLDRAQHTTALTFTLGVFFFCIPQQLKPNRHTYHNHIILRILQLKQKRQKIQILLFGVLSLREFIKIFDTYHCLHCSMNKRIIKKNLFSSKNGLLQAVEHDLSSTDTKLQERTGYFINLCWFHHWLNFEALNTNVFFNNASGQFVNFWSVDQPDCSKVLIDWFVSTHMQPYDYQLFFCMYWSQIGRNEQRKNMLSKLKSGN